jgi:hypothetical protein
MSKLRQKLRQKGYDVPNKYAEEYRAAYAGVLILVTDKQIMNLVLPGDDKEYMTFVLENFANFLKRAHGDCYVEEPKIYVEPYEQIMNTLKMLEKDFNATMVMNAEDVPMKKMMAK